MWSVYINPPAKAIVLCVDEKPSIQALERAQGYLKLPNGRALTGQSHDYKRHGTTTLFAALEVAAGRIIAAHSKRRRRVEFLSFMNSIVAAFRDRELHVILDNLATHKKNERWFKKHPNVHFHFTPTRSSWLNQVETWFSILQSQSLNGASFTAVEQLQEHIDAFVKAYNETAEPFAWTKKKVHQRRKDGGATVPFKLAGTLHGRPCLVLPGLIRTLWLWRLPGSPAPCCDVENPLTSGFDRWSARDPRLLRRLGCWDRDRRSPTR